MNKTILALILLFFCHIGFSQNFDVRKACWGMTINDVVKSELLTPGRQTDTTFQSTFLINSELVFHKVIIGNLVSDIYYFFSNGKLVEVRYQINNNKDSIQSLFDKVLKTKFIYNLLTTEKLMNRLYCWTYDNASYQVFSGKSECEFANKAAVDNVEKIGISVNYVSKAMYVLHNISSNASFEYWLKDKSNSILANINFTPTSQTSKKLKLNDF
jgi:hypothetical protein